LNSPLQPTPTQRITLPCPAKLNLFLLITGRRVDGYHNLQTAFQLLDYGDELDINITNNSLINLTPAFTNIPTETNLVVRAATLLRQVTGTRFGANLHLTKRLPQGGGVGGGSSDAATTLVGLNHLWQTGLSTDELAELGGSLGADIPLFVRGRSAWAEGTGERLTPLDLPQKWYVVLAPKCAVSTPLVFSHKDLTRDSKHITVRAFLEEGGKNDCQPVVEKLFPQVKDAVDWLCRFGPAQMTGTGACVFAPFNSFAEAQRVFTKRPSLLSGFVAKGVNESPLHQRLPK
jgi:4-diphosphocytidyl-2-C-methyl-D-erythritol kinase